MVGLATLLQQGNVGGGQKNESIPDGQVFAICVWPRAKIGVLQVTLSLTLYLFLS